MAYQSPGDCLALTEQWFIVARQGLRTQGGCPVFRGEQHGSLYYTVMCHYSSSRLQDEDFEEDEGIYDDLNLDEEEEKFGLAPDDGDSDDSDEASEGMQNLLRKGHTLCWHRHTTPNPKET
jgi:hypothetical protein